MQVTEPSVERVQQAIARFEQENSHEERALRGLFSLLPRNDDPAHVLLKACTVNSIYSTHVFAVRALAEHICSVSGELDRLIVDGDLAAFDLLEKFQLDEEHEFHLYSFASKYLSWHRPEVYPIYDSCAWTYVRALSKQVDLPWHDDDLWPYAKFCSRIDRISNAFGLYQFSYKQLDAFFYFEGKELLQKKQS